jgi:hypothetical protein
MWIGFMKRDSIGSKIERQPLKAKILNECWCCHAVGFKPGVLETQLGDYGMRDLLKGRYEELRLSAEGLCDNCVMALPSEPRRPSEP